MKKTEDKNYMENNQMQPGGLNRLIKKLGVTPFILCLVASTVFGAGEVNIKKEIKRLRSKKADIRIESVAKLSANINKDKIKIGAALVLALEDKDARVRAQAASALGNTGEKSAVKPLLSTLDNEENNFAKVNILQALGLIGDKKALPHILNALRDKSEPVRYAAVYALKLIKSRNSIPFLKKALKDKSPRIRCLSAEVLGRMKDKSGLKTALKGAVSKSPDIRMKAVNALMGIKARNAEVKNILEKLSKDENKTVRKRAEMAIKKLGI